MAQRLIVAAAQLMTRPSIAENVLRIIVAIEKASMQGAKLVVFPECAVTGYTVSAMKNFREEDMDEAWGPIMEACEKHKIAAVVGTPLLARNKRFNSAIVIDETGQIVGWQVTHHLHQLSGDEHVDVQNKMQLVPPDEVAGCSFGEQIFLCKIAGVKACTPRFLLHPHYTPYSNVP